MTLPDIRTDVGLYAFAVPFPRVKPFSWGVHMEQVGQFRIWCQVPGLSPRLRAGFVKGLVQWSESFAALVARN